MLKIDRVTAAHYAVYAPPDDTPPEPASAEQLREAAWLLVHHGQTEAAVELLRLAKDRER